MWFTSLCLFVCVDVSRNCSWPVSRMSLPNKSLIGKVPNQTVLHYKFYCVLPTYWKTRGSLCLYISFVRGTTPKLFIFLYINAWLFSPNGADYLIKRNPFIYRKIYFNVFLKKFLQWKPLITIISLTKYNFFTWILEDEQSWNNSNSTKYKQDVRLTRNRESNSEINFVLLGTDFV